MSLRAGHRAAARAFAFGAALSGCILQDTLIEIADEKITNRNPVRLVEPVVLSDEAELACDPKLDDMKLVVCPQPATDPRDALPHYLDPNYTFLNDGDVVRPWYFCSCAQDQFDFRALIYTLYVEDQDEEPRTRDPKDRIYAALFLDLPPRTNEPQNYEDYPDYLNSLTPLDLAAEIDYKPLYRRDPHIRQLILGDTDFPLDLCNGGRTALPVGLHTLTVMVTDRPWFTNKKGVPQIGMPDIASGATFDTITYAFFCHADTDQDTDPCQCVDEDEVGS